MSIYSDIILADHPTAYWRLNDKGKNYLTNSGFENGSTGWQQWFHPSAGAAIDSSVAFDGIASARVGPVVNGLCTGWQQTVFLQVGTYIYSAYVKTSADFAPLGQPGLSIEAVSGTATNMGTVGQTPGITANMDWTRIRHPITVTVAGTFNFETVNSYGSTASGTIWFDDCLLEAGSTPTAYSSLPYSASVIDLSGNGHTGTINGSVAKEVAGAIIDKDAAMAFDGVSGVISVPDHADLHPNIITLETWFYVIGAGGGSVGNIIAKGDNAEYRFRRNSTGSLTWFDRGGTNAVSTANGLFPFGTWFYVICEGDASGLRVYKNTSLIASNAVAYGAGGGLAPFNIGSDPNFNEWFNGIIDEVAVYNYILSAQQKMAHFQAADTTEFKNTNYAYSRDGGKILTRDGIGIPVSRNGGEIYSRDAIGVIKTR